MDKDQSWQQWFDAAVDSLTAAQLLGKMDIFVQVPVEDIMRLTKR